MDESCSNIYLLVFSWDISIHHGKLFSSQHASRFTIPGKVTHSRLDYLFWILQINFHLSRRSGFNPILHGGGTMCTHPQMIVRDASKDAPNKLIFHDFVSFQISQGPLGHFSKKILKILKKSKKKIFLTVLTQEKNRKNFLFQFFFNISHTFSS